MTFVESVRFPADRAEALSLLNGLSGSTWRHILGLMLRQGRGGPAYWQDMIDIARGEGVSLILYKGLKDRNGLVPHGYLEGLKRDYSNVLIQNKYYFRELAHCLKAIDVPVILLKGAALLPVVYNDLGARSLLDFDILIRHKDLEEVTGGLRELDYEPHGILGPNVNRLTFVRQDRRTLPIEVHWHIENGTFPNLHRISLDKLWQEALPVEIEGYKSLILAPHHQLLHLSVHALRHTYDRLILMYDMHKVIGHYEELDWDKLVREAREFYLTRPLYYSLYLTRRWMGTSIPQHVLDRLKPLSLGLEERVFLNLINKDTCKPGLQGLLYFAMCRGVKDKMWFLWQALFPPGDILAAVAGLDDTRIGTTHYLRGISWRLKCLWGLMEDTPPTPPA